MNSLNCFPNTSGICGTKNMSAIDNIKGGNSFELPPLSYKKVRDIYKIQLFDYNCVACTSGITEVYTDDIEDFAKLYTIMAKNDPERIERFLESKSGKIVSDYYNDGPEFNIVNKLQAENIFSKILIKKDLTVMMENAYGFKTPYHFDSVDFLINYSKIGDLYYKLVIPFCKGCSLFFQKKHRKVNVYGNPFWIIDNDKAPYSSEKQDDFSDAYLKSYVYQVARKFDDMELVAEDIRKSDFENSELNNIFADLQGDC